jgi:2-polyprenyl-6-hydroxyphenyl methylase/3-demethylubiquinone-9 3-methyltransferase
VLRLLPRGTHDWQKFIKPSELDGYCRAAGLKLDEIIGLTYNPLSRHYKLAQDVDVNYMVSASKPGPDSSSE